MLGAGSQPSERFPVPLLGTGRNVGLEGDSQPRGYTSRWRHCSSGEQAGKIDDVDTVHQIRYTDLDGGAPLTGVVYVEAGSCIQGKTRTHASTLKIDAA